MNQMHKHHRIVSVLVVAVSAAGVALADTLNVPAQYPTIQAAIDAASNNDTVQVADGTYTGPGNKNLDFQAKAITLRSESGNRELCIIDCEDDGQFATFGTSDTAVVESITIQNGNAGGSGGAALLISGCSPSFIDCVFQDCATDFNGGALAVFVASVTIDGCVFRDNTASVRGGAIYASSASVTLLDTEFELNQASRGGGAFISAGEVTVSGCSFTGNTTTPGLGGGGAGLRVANNGRLICTDSSFTANIAACGGAGLLANAVDPGSRISDCRFTNNEALGGCGGGGLGSTGNFPEISDCIFEGNVAGFAGGVLFRNFNTTRVENVVFLNNTARWGGGVEVEPGNSPEFVNCLFAGNIATGGGESPSAAGAIDVYGSGAESTMVNCTFSDNSSEALGGAVNVSADAHLQLVNCVLWGDDAPDGAEIYIGYPEPGFEGGTVTVSYSDVAGGQAGVSIGPGGTLNWGAGNIDLDPLFVDPVTGDYHVSAGSPVIDAADNTAVPAGILTDLDGNPRFVDDLCTTDTGNGTPPVVDMGTYEFQLACRADLDGNGVVDLPDMGILLADFGCTAGVPPACPGDIDCDGDTDLADLGILLAEFGSTCP